MQALVMNNSVGTSGNLEKIFEKKFTTLIAPDWGSQSSTSRSETLITFSDFVSPQDVYSLIVKVSGSYYVNNLTETSSGNTYGVIHFKNQGTNEYLSTQYWGDWQNNTVRASGTYSGTFIIEYYSTYNAFVSLAEINNINSNYPVTGMYLNMAVDNGYRMSILPDFTIQVYAQKLNLD